jgi:cyanophycinase
LIAAVQRATAVFMTGGNQVKLATLMVGTPLGAAILAAHRRGALIAGTSAGASILSAHMVSFGSGGATPKFRIGQVSQGLGLLDDVIVDQHFTQRNRFGRLLALIASNPAQLGVGIDEDTAAIFRPDGLLEVKGRGVVTIVDGSDVVTTSYTATGTQPLMMSGIQLHTLPRGAIFDLCSRRLVSAPGLPDTSTDPTIAVPADVPAGTRPRSRRIAAEGAHETTSELRRRPASS